MMELILRTKSRAFCIHEAKDIISRSSVSSELEVMFDSIDSPKRKPIDSTDFKSQIMSEALFWKPAKTATFHNGSIGVSTKPCATYHNTPWRLAGQPEDLLLPLSSSSKTMCICDESPIICFPDRCDQPGEFCEGCWECWVACCCTDHFCSFWSACDEDADVDYQQHTGDIQPQQGSPEIMKR